MDLLPPRDLREEGKGKGKGWETTKKILTMMVTETECDRVVEELKKGRKVRPRLGTPLLGPVSQEAPRTHL